MLNKVTINDNGDYQCVGEMKDKKNNETYSVMVGGICKFSPNLFSNNHLNDATIQLGMELIKLGDSGDPLEGTNVTLICLVDSFYTKAIQWSMIKSESKEPVALNETDLPEGVKEIAYYRRKNCIIRTDSLKKRNGDFRRWNC